MGRPVMLSTGQWADLPLDEPAGKAGAGDALAFLRRIDFQPSAAVCEAAVQGSDR